MLDTEERREFEKRLVRTFCDDGYLQDGFNFIKLDESQIIKLQSIESLVTFLMDSKVTGKYFLFECWLTDSFDGLRSSYEKCLLRLPPQDKLGYQNDSGLKSSLSWLYKVFYSVHKSLLREHEKEVALNYLTGDYDEAETCGYDPDEYQDCIRARVHGEQYESKLNILYQEATGIQKTTTRTTKKISKELTQILSMYFKRKPKDPEAKRYINESPLEVKSKVIPCTVIDNYLDNLSKEIKPKHETVKAYAQYLHAKGKKTKNDIRRGDSLKTGARDRLFQKLYDEVLSAYLE